MDVGLTDNPSALLWWMVAGPEVSQSIQEFEIGSKMSDDTLHHDQTTSVQVSFIKDVCSLVSVMEKLGNPFEQESKDLIVLCSKEISEPLATEAVKKVKQTGEQQFELSKENALLRERKQWGDSIPRNKLTVFGTSTVSGASKKQKFSTLS